MNETVFLTVLTGVVTFVIGQLVVKLLIEPVQEMRRTIAQISHTMIERANVYQNPGIPTQEIMIETSQQTRKLSSQLHAHLYLVPAYSVTARIFFLPPREKVLAASSALIGLSNSVFKAVGDTYRANAKKVEVVCDSLGIYLEDSARWPEDLK